MLTAARTRPFVVATVLFSREDADAVRGLLEAIAPDQGLSFLLLEDDSWTDDVRAETRTRVFGASRLRNEIVSANSFIEPNAVYFLPRGRAQGLVDGELQLRAADHPAGGNGFAPFFASLVGDQAPHSSVLVFAGSGIEDALRNAELAMVARSGGLVLVQEVVDGDFGRIMRSSAETTPEATLVRASDVANVVMEHGEPLIAETRPRTTTALYSDIEHILPALCRVLLNATGHDFGHYKSSTLIRSTLRRLHRIHCQSAELYLDQVKGDKVEALRLFNDLLISVTSFFRDPEAFAALRELALPRIFADAARTDTVRIWVAGCATGEEAYSIAMLIREYADAAGWMPPVQIFATDLDEEALTHARRGRYTPARLAHVAPERVARFFTRVEGGYQVSREIRDLVLFTRHSVTNDPPFSKLDLVSCRNLLIYLGEELHRRVIPLFHYALRPHGILFLGPSESISAHSDLFRPLDSKHRISERLDSTKRTVPFPTLRPGASGTRPHAAIGGAPEPDALHLMQQALSEQFTPKGVVVTEEGHIVAVSGNVDEFLAVTGGSFINNIARMVRDGLRVAVRAALRESVTMQTRVEHHGGTLRTAAGVQSVSIIVQPLAADPEAAGLYLVVFRMDGRPVSPHAAPTPQHTEGANALIERLEVDLTAAREELQRTVQDLEAVNEELKSSNEELLSMNEELQSSNEELESSKEDLLDVNGALEASNSDLANLLASTRIPTIFLDNRGNVRRTTPSVQLIYNLRAEDVGRPLEHFTHRAVHMPALPGKAELEQAVKPVADEVAMLDGTSYQRRVLPYVTPEGTHEGVVVTFTDVTERRAFEAGILATEARLRAVIDSMFAFVGVVDVDGTLLEVNASALGVGRLMREDVIGLPFWDCPWFSYEREVSERVRAAFERACRGETVRYDEAVRTPKDGRISIDFSMQPVYRNGVLQFVIPSAVDITHRVRAETLVRNERNLARTIMCTATTAIFVTDKHNLVTFANPAGEAMTGFTADELAGFALHDRIHHTRRDGTPYPAHECALNLAIPNRQNVHNHEDWFVRKDGSFFPVVCNVTVIESGGEVDGLVVEVRDTTTERQTARAVAEGQMRFRQLAETIPQLAWMAHANGDVFWYNERWYAYTGTTLETMRQSGWVAVHDPAVLPIVLDRWKLSLETGAAFDMVFPLRGADGTFRQFLTRMNPFRDEDGKIVLWFGTNTDVSEERERAETLRRRQRELQTLADNTPDILTRFDRERRHVFVNNAVTRISGLEPSAVIGRTCREIGMPDHHCDLWENTIDRVFKTGHEQNIEFQYDTAEGKLFFAGRFVPELGPDGEVQYALAVTRDRTREHASELALIEANRRKDEFLATLAHELRNPLAPVRNGLEILRLTENGDARAEQVRGIMERQVVTMTRLIDDLLDVSRISLGKVALKRQPVDIRLVLEDALEVSRQAMVEAQHELLVNAPETPLVLHADGTRLAQVIGNLLHNSAKYTPEGGRIELSAVRDASDVVIRVSDNGIGIPEDMLTRVFDMFTQIAHTTGKTHGGLGIGLALVRQLVEMHGGSVHAESAGTAAGSTFVVRLPLAGNAEAQAEVVEEGPAANVQERADAATEQLSILVVDDNADAARSLAAVLELMGHEARYALTGAEAMKMLAGAVPDFVFLDIGLPDMSGYELAAIIRSDARLNRTIVIALTGWGSDDHRRRSVEAGFDFHLTKPADTAIIRRILARAVR